MPQGLSLWELSVNKNANSKAEADYAKRTTTPDGSPMQECTYVEVVLRPWTKRADWARGHTADGRWKAVKAIGVDEVETWLESAPITHAWLSELNGLHPYGLVTAETWWNAWSAATTPLFPTGAVTAGRDKAATALRETLARPGEIITIRGASRDEVAAFVAAIAMAEEATDGGALLARTAFVDNVETWRRLRTHRTPLVLVALTDQVAADFWPGSPHVLIVPRTGTSEADIILPPIDAQVAAEALKRAGLPQRQSEEAGQLARLSLLAAWLRLANKRELYQPAWAETPARKAVRRLALVGRWNEYSDADRALVEKSVGVPYDTLREEIATLTTGGNPLLARVGGTIGVVSPVDAWLLLRGELRHDDFEAFHDAARTVLAEIDPRLDLPREDQWLAQVRGKNRAYSNDLRKGLATTLALLGAYGVHPIAGTNSTGREWAARIVRDALLAANADASGHLWASLADVLPLLAEAAPEEFLDAVAAGTSGQSPVLREMFEDTADNGSPLVPGSAHTHLLWALEACAWSPDHFGRVIDVLARLAEIDQGGRLANRPLASLHEIFLPWYPQAAVSAERRLAAIDGLRERHPAVAWQLLTSLIPEPGGVTSNINEPQFRDWRPEKITVTNQEYWTVIDEICARVLTDAGHDPDRWLTLIEKIDDSPLPSRAVALARLAELSGDSSLSAEHQAAIWEALRAKAAQHREFATADWALPPDEVDTIEATVARFAPAEPTERYRWLFTQQAPMLGSIRRSGDYAAYDTELAKLRATAAAGIAAATDWSGLRSFAASTGYPWSVGEAVARARRHEHESAFLALLGAADPRDAAFAEGYFSERFRTDGWGWLEPYLNGGALAPDQAAQLLLYTREYPKAWEVAAEMGALFATRFWQQFRPYGLGNFGYVDFAAERLLEVGRPGTALDLITIYARREEAMSPVRVELVARGLEALLGPDIGQAEIRAFDHYDLVELMSTLERSELPRDRLARLEWAYLPALGIDARPVALTAELASNPDFFADIIRSTFRPRDGEDDDGTEAVTETEEETPDEAQRVATARNAYRLLSEWKDIPGRRADGTVDAYALDAWVTHVRVRLRESGHGEVGDSRIGHVLAWGPTDADGSRPCLAVRNLLEKLQNSDVENGLMVELRNSRGVTNRDVFDGGDPERAVAAGYREQAKKFADQWPRTAALLRKVAESYEQEARPIDDEAERRRTGFDG